MKLRKVENKNGPTLLYDEESGMDIIERDHLYFKNHSQSGELLPYEDWRLTPKERAKDLAERLSIKDVAGLMLFTSHLSIPAKGPRADVFEDTYGGKRFEESEAFPYSISDNQQKFILDNRIKHTLVTTVESPEVMAKWNNQVQALAESVKWGIPIVHASDPRHGVKAETEFNEGSGGDTSSWPEQIGLGATFDPNLVREFTEIASAEYRAMGFTLTLSPQIDLATEPRWMRLNGSFSESAELTTDMAKAYVEGFQTSISKSGIQTAAVNTMAKHWPGGGTGEGGRDAHFRSGKYNVYPGDNLNYHLKPFVEGVFSLDEEIEKTTSVMPYYSISYNQDEKNYKNVGNAYSSYLITDLLREIYQYDEVVCTDWSITDDEPEKMTDLFPGGRSWGVEEGYTVAERHKLLLDAGVDQYGGNNDPAPILEAYDLMVEEYGEEAALKRMRESARRILKNIFQLGLFENPYVDEKQANKIVGQESFVQAGLKAQKKSIVLLKNKKNVLPLAKKTKVYIPKRTFPEKHDWFGNKVEAYEADLVHLDTVAKHLEIVEEPEAADIAYVKIKSPERDFLYHNGFSEKDKEEGGNGFMPISLQYRPYTAEYAREGSIAGDDRETDVLNRSYNGKSTYTVNEADLDLVIETKREMREKPVIVVVQTANPFVVAEFEKEVDALLLEFGVSEQAVCSILTGETEPSGCLPVQMPKDMKTVEEQYEDMPFDLSPYTDECGNSYDFGFGMNYSGVIKEERVEKYKK